MESILLRLLEPLFLLLETGQSILPDIKEATAIL